ncbi:MAG: Stp1/IreP family PP2C-type Ser/Thr phosphatase [Desulfobacterales bacterium]|nr:Stp1/IreP family PP2C-type Ser/Thr phosphatase [Desulfobacterales bacterium]
MFNITIGSASDTGMKRKENQDYHAYFPPEDGCANRKGLLVALADGMGGHSGGQMASRLAVETLMQNYYRNDDENIPASLTQAFLDANEAVIAKGEHDMKLRGMGSTLTAVVFKDGRMFFGHVGDSRGYTIVGHTMTQFTEDHSFVASLVKAGAIKPEEAKDHPESNIITRAIGMSRELKVDAPSSGMKLHNGQSILLCCDGLWGVVPEEEILSTVKTHPEPKIASEKLVELANANGGPDNITVVIARIDGIGLLSSLTSKLAR